MAMWMLGLKMLLTVVMAPLPVDVSWVPPLQIGVRVPALLPEPTDRALVRRPWCDFGLHAQRRGQLAPGMDPVFRRLSPQAKTVLNTNRELALNPADYTGPKTAETHLLELLKTPDGPPLARTLLQDQQPVMLGIGLRMARQLVAQHPRLAAFATGYLAIADPQLALEAMEVHMAAECDTAVQYGMDGFKHPSEAVQIATLRRVFELAQNHDDLRLPGRILAWMREGYGSPLARVVALRMATQLGWLSSATDAEVLTGDKQDAVAGEAMVLLAMTQPVLTEGKLAKWLKEKSPIRRAGALRAFAQVNVYRPDVTDKLLRPLLEDRTVVTDAVTGEKRTLGDLAEAAMRYLEGM